MRHSDSSLFFASSLSGLFISSTVFWYHLSAWAHCPVLAIPTLKSDAAPSPFSLLVSSSDDDTGRLDLVSEKSEGLPAGSTNHSAALLATVQDAEEDEVHCPWTSLTRLIVKSYTMSWKFISPQSSLIYCIQKFTSIRNFLSFKMPSHR